MDGSIQDHFQSQDYAAAINACQDTIAAGNRSFELQFLLAGAYYLNYQYKSCQSQLIQIIDSLPLSHIHEFNSMLNDCNTHIHCKGSHNTCW